MRILIHQIKGNGSEFSISATDLRARALQSFKAPPYPTLDVSAYNNMLEGYKMQRCSVSPSLT